MLVIYNEATKKDIFIKERNYGGIWFDFYATYYRIDYHAIGSRPEILAKEMSREYSLTLLEIIKSRYTRGEISKEGFQQLLRDLE
jgi:hypothetical protein